MTEPNKIVSESLAFQRGRDSKKSLKVGIEGLLDKIDTRGKYQSLMWMLHKFKIVERISPDEDPGIKELIRFLGPRVEFGRGEKWVARNTDGSFEDYVNDYMAAHPEKKYVYDSDRDTSQWTPVFSEIEIPIGEIMTDDTGRNLFPPNI